MRIPLRLKFPLGVVVQWQETVARDGHQWSWVVQKKLLGFGWAFEEEDSGKKHVFSH